MPLYEYKVVSRELGIERMLNYYGADGWRLIAVQEAQPGFTSYILERPIATSSLPLAKSPLAAGDGMELRRS